MKALRRKQERQTKRFLRLSRLKHSGMAVRRGLRKVPWGLLYFVGKQHLRSISAIASKQADKLVTRPRAKTRLK